MPDSDSAEISRGKQILLYYHFAYKLYPPLWWMGFQSRPVHDYCRRRRQRQFDCRHYKRLGATAPPGVVGRSQEASGGACVVSGLCVWDPTARLPPEGTAGTSAYSLPPGRPMGSSPRSRHMASVRIRPVSGKPWRWPTFVLNIDSAFSKAAYLTCFG